MYRQLKGAHVFPEESDDSASLLCLFLGVVQLWLVDVQGKHSVPFRCEPNCVICRSAAADEHMFCLHLASGRSVSLRCDM